MNVNTYEVWEIVLSCDSYTTVASVFASNRKIANQVILDALEDDAFSEEFLYRIYSMAADDDPPNISIHHYDKLAGLVRERFVRVAQEAVAEFLMEELHLPDQYRSGSEWSQWYECEVDTHFEAA